MTKATNEGTPSMTAKELAAELGTDPKSFRRWLRGLTEDRAGKGGRWEFDSDTADSIRDLWANRNKAKTTTPTLRADEDEVDEDDIEELED